ncbi:MAG: SH3 domain-containing protein, partial [Anaerolineales bacterium]
AITGYKPTPFQISTLNPPTDSSATMTTNETPEFPPSQGDPTIAPSEPTTQASPTQILPTATIANTGGAGANIRSAPGLAGTIITTLPEGTSVILLDETQQVDGFNWQSIEMPDTRNGWVAVQFLIPEN